MSDKPLVTLEELQELSIKAFKGGQQRLAGCLLMLAEAHEDMRLGEMFDLMNYYRRGQIEMEPIEPSTEPSH